MILKIDQESVLRYFRVADPNANKMFGMAKNSTKISLETVQLLLHGLSEHLKQGLSLIEIENIIFFILFVRFLLLALKYNKKTALFICLISFGATLLWYLHLKDVLIIYKDQLAYLKIQVLSGMRADIRAQYLYSKSNRWAFEFAYERSKVGQLLGPHYGELRDPFDFFNVKYAFLRAVTINDHYTDPFSMFFARLPNSVRESTDKFYYIFTQMRLAEVWMVTIRTIKRSTSTILWIFFTRKRKRFCPYFIRWHWTFITALEIVSSVYYFLTMRLWAFAFIILKPQGRDLEFFFAITMVKSLILLQVIFSIYAIFHCAFGQYFYVPMLTENTEVHVGPRPKDSIYSGGYTEWQDVMEAQLKYFASGGKKLIIPRIWYGWFGKDRKIPFKIRKFIVNIIKKILRVFFRRRK